jgi:hypothetical protein
VVYVPDVNGPKCLLGCIPKYETLEPLETQKEVNGTLIHLSKRNEIKTQKKRKDTFAPYPPDPLLVGANFSLVLCFLNKRRGE